MRFAVFHLIATYYGPKITGDAHPLQIAERLFRVGRRCQSDGYSPVLKVAQQLDRTRLHGQAMLLDMHSRYGDFMIRKIIYPNADRRETAQNSLGPSQIQPDHRFKGLSRHLCTVNPERRLPRVDGDPL